MKPTYYSDYLKYKRLCELLQLKITQLETELKRAKGKW